MSSFNNATNVSHQIAAAVVARNLQQQQQQANIASNSFKSHSLLPFQNRIGSKPNSVGSLPSSPSPPQIPPSAPALPITPQSLFENHCNDNLSLLTAQQKLSSPAFQPSVINTAASIGETTTGPVDPEGATTAANMAAAAFTPGIPAFLQHIIHGKCIF